MGSPKNANVTLARQLFAWFKDGDLEPFYAALDENVVARSSLNDGNTIIGREHVVEWWSSMAADGGETEVRPLDFEVVGDCVLVRGYLRHRKNRQLSESQVYWLCEIRDGRVVRMESHPNRASAVAAC